MIETGPSADAPRTVQAACPHDCPDTCAMQVTVQDGRVVRIQGDPEHPPTHGALCTKVSRYAERTYHPERVLHPLRRVTIHAAAAELAALDEHLFAEPLFPSKPPCEFRPLADETRLPGCGRLTHFPLAHTGACRGYRLDWPGHSLACVTDTTAAPDAAYVHCIRGVDLLLHECNFGDDFAERARVTGHSHTSPVADVARQAEVKRLVLLHINPLAPADDPIGLAAARAIFPAIEVGYDRMEIEF